MKRSRKSEVPPEAPHTKEYWHAEFLKTFRRLSLHNRPEQVFQDFIEMAACSISNAVDPSRAVGREARYMALINSYTRPEDREEFGKLLAALTMALDAEMHDALGHIWMQLEFRQGWKGQFWTPYTVSLMMAQMTFVGCQEIIDNLGFVRACEPACGPGGMIVAMADAMREQGFDYQQTLHVQGVDIDPRCVHMAYIQASLLHIPAVITVGDSLRMEMKDHWLTPAHIMGRWSAKLDQRDAHDAALKLMLEPSADPVPVELATLLADLVPDQAKAAE